MTYEEWVETYRPIKNEFDPNANFDGTMFETFGEEVDFVKAQPDPRCIWTYICGDGETITSGWHFVNRMGYFITEVPFEGDFLEIDMSDPEDDDRRYKADRVDNASYGVIDSQADGFQIICTVPFGLTNAEEIAETIAEALNNECAEFDLSHEDDNHD